MRSVGDVKAKIAAYIKADGRFAGADVSTAFSQAQRKFPLKKPLVLVGVQALEVLPGAMGRYFGGTVQDGLMQTEVFGSEAIVTLRFDLYSPTMSGGKGCEQLHEGLCDALVLSQGEINLEQLECGEIIYDKSAGSSRMTVLGKLRTALTLGHEGTNITSFDIVNQS